MSRDTPATALSAAEKHMDLLAFLESLPPPRPPPDSRTLEPDRNSMLYWFPKIAAAGLPVPETELVRIDNRTLWPLCDGLPVPDAPEAELRQAAERIGFPCFIRSDQSSAKHSGPRAYRADSPEGVLPVVLDTFMDSCLKDLTVLAFAFRRWLDLDAPFRAFGYGDDPGHPIACEWRAFADSERCWCIHFYWPDYAIEGHNPTREDWRETLADLASELPPSYLPALAIKAVRALGENPTHRWSVDFARAQGGNWWVIDMAAAESSWHPEECVYRGTKT